MQIHTATFVASAMSGVALICCLLSMAQIYNNVQNFWSELDGEMDAFKSNTDQVFKATFYTDRV